LPAIAYAVDLVRLIHPITGMTPAQILGDSQTDGLDMGELMQYRSAGIMHLGIDMRATTSRQSMTFEIDHILGEGIA
jgi:hypothetical protein